MLALTATSAFAWGVNLQWDPSPSTDVVGYRIYYGSASGSYDFVVDVGDVLTYDLNAGFPNDDTWRYFAITAYDYEGHESDYSNEVKSNGIESPDSGSPPTAPSCWIGAILPDQQ